MTFLKTSLLTLAVLATAAQVWAGQAPAKQAAQLANAREDVAQAAINTKGSQRGQLMMQQQKLQGLIDDLQAGRRVDPAEIDRALRDAERSTP